MLCNILAFPAVLAVFYFINYLLYTPDLQSKTQLPFGVTSRLGELGGTSTLPLFGGLDLNFIRILLAFGAIIATPSIPDIICEAIGKVGRAGGMIEQAISGNIGEGRRYLGQAQGGVGSVSRDVSGLGNLRDQYIPQYDQQGKFVGWTLQPGPVTKLRAFTGKVPPKIIKP